MIRDLAQELTAHKYANVERERRWLVHPDRRPALDGLDHIRIADRYVRGSRLRLRRMTDSATGHSVCKLSKKYEASDPLARPMVTTYLTEAEFALLCALPADVLDKRRFRVPGAGRLFSLDRFEGPLAGLETIEIEMPDDASLRALDAPGWAGREVSHDPRYQGGALAANGIPEETAWPSS